MKKAIYTIGILLLGLVSCKDDDINLFEKTADERAAEAIANLKQDLVAPANGWRIKYKPEDESGSFYVLMDFDENNKVNIKTDLGTNNGEYFEQTISYRIDNSMGLELILENYSFFSFLFEQDQATFGAEYEFNFINKTPDNALVFNSKNDISFPSLIVFEQAAPGDENLLGLDLANNLNILSNDLDKFTSSLKLTYNDKDLALYISLDELRRTITISSASLKTNTSTVETLNFNTSYLIQGDSIIFDQALAVTILGNAVSIKSLKLNDIAETSITVCPDPIMVHTFSGVTSANDDVLLETSLLDVNGKSFATLSDFFFSPLGFIFDNGASVTNQITEDVAGALEMHMYYGLELNDGTLLYGIGFVIQNLDGSITFALREFTPVLNDNNLVFNFAPDISLFGNPNTDANVDNVNIYLNALSEGDKTYVFQLNENLYEFYNPCTGWSFVFANANQ
ncbi:MAG: DUF4302 domain-containing protein [Cyclobacteriaceae bacterium]